MNVSHTPNVSHTSVVLYSPKFTYAASACAALAVGFGALSVAIFAARGSRSQYFAANLGAASACATAAAVLCLAAPQVKTLPGHTRQELPNDNQADPVDYSIIIPIYNRPEHIRALLRKLASLCSGWLPLGSGEIVIVDDGSTDDTPAVARELAAGMPIPTRIVSKANGGVSSARNAGFSAARGDICVVIDSDCLPEEGWLPAMLSAVRSDPALVSFARIRNSRRLIYPLENMPDSKGFVGASYAMERLEYLKLGGCYERYGASHDDRDLVLKALANGYRVRHADDAWIEHPLRRESIRSMWNVGLNSMYGNLLAARHGSQAAKDTRPTPYYLFGIGSNYGSSIAMIVGISNVAITGYLVARQPTMAGHITWGLIRALFLAFVAYVSALGSLGLLVGAGMRDLPNYVATLATFHLATFLGRLRGTFYYGVFLL